MSSTGEIYGRIFKVLILICLRRTFNGHLSGSIASTVVTNLSWFRVGAWQLKVNDHKFKRIARIESL